MGRLGIGWGSKRRGKRHGPARRFKGTSAGLYFEPLEDRLLLAIEMLSTSLPSEGATDAIDHFVANVSALAISPPLYSSSSSPFPHGLPNGRSFV